MRTSPLLFALALTLSCGDKTPPEAAAEAAPPVASDDPVAASIEAALDRSVDPCTDFHQFACGGWLADNEIPGDQVSWGRSFHEIAKRNQELLKTILEEDSDSRVGMLYASCMDTESVEAAGIAPLTEIFAEIDATEDKAALMAVSGGLARKGVNLWLGGWPGADYKNPDHMMLNLLQGGIGLPDRDYYLSEDKALVEAYTAHIAAVLELAGISAEQAGEEAAAIVVFETRLAEASVPRSQLWDPATSHHPTTREELAALAPKVDWDGYFGGLGHDIQDINLMTPDFFGALSTAIDETELSTLQAYARFHTAKELTAFLPQSFVDARFDFYGKTLSGQKEARPRYKRCVTQVDNAVGELLGKAYVERAFAGDSKDIALEMISAIEEAFEAGLAELDWMDDDTRAKAAEKAQQITNKIGYPDDWETYEGVVFKPGDLMGNTLTARAWGFDDVLKDVGGPVDKTEWYMSASTVNAYYNPSANEIVFPAGILQPPFFDAGFPRAMNFGAIGMVVGHEITHGFDDDGRKFDGTGRMHEWWAPEVAERFEERTACVVEQYADYDVEGGKLDGELTLGENIADMGGIKQTHRAYMAWAEKNGAEEGKAGFTAEQLVFLGFAQAWCMKDTPEYAAMKAKTDSHSPGRYRVNGALVNTPEFGEAFGCEVGSPMRPPEDEICEVW